MIASIIEHNPTAIFAIDREGRVAATNPAFASFLGQSMEGLSGVPVETLAAGIEPGWGAHVVELARAGNPQHYAITFRLAGGSLERALVTILPERGDHPEIEAYGFVTGGDYSSQVEQQLRQLFLASQSPLTAIFNSGATGIIFFDLGGQIIDTNPALQVMLGYDAVTLRTMSIVDLVHPADRLTPPATSEDQFADLVTGDRDHYRAVRRYVHGSGHLIWAQVTVSGVRDERGELQYFICLMQDITDRKLLEDVAVIANRARAVMADALHTIIEELAVQLGFQAAHVYLFHEQTGLMAPTGIWYLSSRDILPRFREATATTSFPPDRGLVGHVFGSRTAVIIRDLPHDPHSLRRPAAEADGVLTGLFVPMVIEDDIVGVIEFYSTEDRTADPALLEALTQIAPHLGWLVERERAREAVERQNADLERVNRELERFTSLVSDDLQEALHEIDRCAELLERRYADVFDPGAARLINYIIDRVELMETLIMDVQHQSHSRG